MKTEIATFAGGCFWGIEYVFSKLPGVLSVRSGYTGGKMKNPSYEDVSSDETGHAEAVEIVFDPKKISYKILLGVFWRSHDPTQLSRQGPDIGSQYRSTIFYHNEKQKKEAIESRNEEQKKYRNKIVTQIEKAGEFYPAEYYHQKYAEKHGTWVCHIPDMNEIMNYVKGVK